MIDYRSPVGDIVFALEYGAGAARLAGWDGELAGAVIAEAARLVDAEIAPLDPLADRGAVRLVDRRVVLAEPFVAAYRRFAEGGWPGLTAPRAHGGQEMPHVMWTAVSEMLSGACVGFQTMLALAQAGTRAIAAHASDTQKAAYLPRLASGEWLATMCLTEPQAGSDLGLVRTTAVPADDGSWRITGAKCLISGGDQNLAANVVHLVLARTEGAPAGTRGLALFLCPAVLPAGGRRNGVSVTRLEDKMGLHGSPTCQMAFDDAWAEIVGAPGEGMARMFTMMNAERLDVGIQGVGLMDVAGQRSRAYAAERRQGRAGGEDGAGQINRHGDVRRMLLEQMALTGGCRVMNYRTAVELELDDGKRRADFLTPVCKAFSADSAVRAADLAIQVHGGYGYCREYRVEQVLRDARITPIYEGTNGIQAMTLVLRLLRIDNGACAAAFRADIADTGSGATGAMKARIEASLADWDRASAAITANPDPGAVAVAYLRLTGLLALAAAWSRLENAADSAPNPPRVRAAAAFARDVLVPETARLADLVASGAPLSDVDDQVFV